MTTAKLNVFQRDMRKMFKAELAAGGGELFSFPHERVTVLVCPSAGEDSNFCQVAVAYCDEADTFRRKVGELMVLERYFDEAQTIPVPFMGRDNQMIADSVVAMLMWE